jgi:D-alanyl-D-alanine carboxypeptidase
LVSSVRANDRQLVAVVLGGNTAAARDARMRELIKSYLPRAYAGTRTAPLIAEAPTPAPTRRATRVATVTAIAEPRPGSADPIRPTPVKTFFVGKSGEAVSPPGRPGTLGVLLGSSLMAPDGAIAQPLQIGPQAAPAPLPPVVGTPSAEAPATVAPAVAAVPAPSPVPPSTTASLPSELPSVPPSMRGGWLIQIGAFTEEREARERLDQARSRFNAILGKADPYTEKTRKGANTYFRARFAGLDETAAKRACSLLKRSDIACLAMKN